ncbi:MAG: helix-turn-helix domain-containing protein [Acidobacteriaceae bacterium]|nr:helix-turn-helix domain-containing protein [Acidobacteriaceae bacterium]
MQKAGDILFDGIADAVAERLLKMQFRPNRLLTAEEAAQYLGLSEDAIRDLVNQGRLIPVRPTRKLQFDIRDLDAFIDSLKG